MFSAVRALFPIVVILIFSDPGVALPVQVVRSVSVEGNAVFTSRDLVESISTRVSVPFSSALLHSDLRLLTERYRHAGYLDMTATTALAFDQDSTGIAITIRIKEGRCAVMGDVHVEGCARFTEDQLISLLDSQRGDPISENTLERDIEEIILYYERSGHPFVTCTVAGMQRRDGDEVDSIDITLRIDEGPLFTIDEIRVRGNEETDASVVVRETRLAAGELFNPLRVDAIRQRLQRLNIFASVATPELYSRNGRGGLLIHVTEGRTSTFDGVIGYNPPSVTGEGGYVTGLASVSMRNLFGTGRKLSVQWQRENRHSQEIGVRYVEPWVLGFPVNLGGGFFQRQQDSAYVRRVLDVETELIVSEEFSARASFISERVIPSTGVLVPRVFRSMITSVGVGMTYDTRDDAVSPVSGARYRTDYAVGTKRVSGVPLSQAQQIPARATVQRLEVDLDAYISTFLHHVVAIGLHGKEVRGGSIEEGDMFRLGGARTLRGFRESQFLGSRIAWSSAEYRLILARRSFVFGFIDGGYYFRPGDAVRAVSQTDAFKYGYGIGAQIETGLGNLGVSFALGQGDNLGQGKIHVGLVNDF
jgi:outer membrane protein insertion porin family